ncbi:peptidylprolyl isomerase [Candidatus Tisiphia endosymbiont of Beris chalybata]|uniref:peptidylprolyl isomerase n=1 Tax=Candidatus Tisiphia endosymbiont of Beris chalybata TaxID=3066262 RepID=UPI00312C6FAB
MLNNIRKTADSFVMKILFGMIIFAFVGWGIKDVLQSNSNFDVVKFTHAKNIRQDEFLKAKAEQIHLIQSQTKVTLNEEDIKQLRLDDFILKRLINNSILSYLVSYYDLDISDNTILQVIKESPNFKNEQGVFDLTLFKNLLKNSYINEVQYLARLKEQILTNTVISIFVEGIPVSDTLVQNIINYLAEIREVDLLQVNLQHQPKGLTIPPPTQVQLEEFYETHKNLFKLPEKRSIAYITITNEILQKLETVHNQLIRELGDEVAAGSSLIEISQKYKLPLQNINYITYNEALKNADILHNADNIFKLTEGELSYPLEHPNQDSCILVEVQEIQPAKIQEFAVVKDQVQKLWKEQYLKDFNLKKIQALSTEYVSGKNIVMPGISINRAAHFIREEIQDNKQLPEGLLSSIFQAPLNSNTPVFQSQGNAYFAHIKSIRIDKVKKHAIQDKNKENIANNIKDGVIEELINYLIKHNKMTINL